MGIPLSIIFQVALKFALFKIPCIHNMKFSKIYTLGVSFVPTIFLMALVLAPLYALTRVDGISEIAQTVFSDEFYRQRLTWTIFQAACTVFLTVLLGVPTAYSLARLEFVGRKWVIRLLMLPFIMPTLVVAMGVLALFGAQGWLWRGWSDTAILLLYGNVFFNLPVMIRAAMHGFLAVPANRLAAAQTLGANAWQRFYHVDFPVLKPWLAQAACLIFLYCFSGFGLALLLGGQQFSTIEVEIYQLIAYELDLSRAAVLVWVVLAITAVSGMLAAYFARKTQTAEIRFRQPEKPKTLPEKLILLFSILILLVCCAMPLLAIGFQAAKADSAWVVLTEETTWHALFNTLRFSAMAVAGAAMLGVLHAAMARRLRAVRALTFLPFMVSPVCLSFGVLLLYPEWVADLPMLIALYILLAYPFVTKDVLATWDSLPENYFAAARTMGATPIQLAKNIWLPLILPALRRGLTLASATCIGEFAATLFLSRPEWTTLTTLIYQYLGKVTIKR